MSDFFLQIRCANLWFFFQTYCNIDIFQGIIGGKPLKVLWGFVSYLKVVDSTKFHLFVLVSLRIVVWYRKYDAPPEVGIVKVGKFTYLPIE